MWPESRQKASNLLLGRPVELRPILDGHDGVPRVNIVKMVIGIYPVAFGVIHHKMDICRHPFRLDGAEIDTQDIGRGELIAHFNSPDTRAGANIENVLQGTFLDGRKKELILTEHFHTLMLHVFAVLLRLVVGEVVPSFPEPVVPTAIFEEVIPHTARQRSGSEAGAVRFITWIGFEVQLLLVYDDGARPSLDEGVWV